jgi:hypothetical protein
MAVISIVSHSTWDMLFTCPSAAGRKAISQNKQKNDKLDVKTIAELLRTNFFPEAYPYPRLM